MVELTGQIVRALRGARSQVQASRRLGYSSNVVYRWEAGLRWPTAIEVLRLAERVGLDLGQVFRRYDRDAAHLASLAAPPGTATHLRAWLAALKRRRSLASLTASTGIGKSALQRLFSGRADVTMPDLLRLVDAIDERLLEFVGAVVPIGSIPALAGRLTLAQAQREQAYRLRWTEAILAALEVHGDAPTPPIPAVASSLGLAEDEVRQVVDALVLTGGLLVVDGRPKVPDPRRVDTTANANAHAMLGEFWARTVAELPPAQVRRGYLVMSVAERDLPRLFAVHFEAHRALVEIVAASNPPERVIVACNQLAALDGGPIVP
ncbi:MAG: helix-turn-helix domain-containing protein [Myxococcota bacterium]